MSDTKRDCWPCPVCREPVDVKDWAYKEASSCESCGSAIFMDFDDTLTTVAWNNVEF